jgi:hypothetical protein
VARHPIGGKGAGHGNDGSVFGQGRNRQEQGKGKRESEEASFHASNVSGGNKKGNLFSPHALS